jgi:hypothetical protein
MTFWPIAITGHVSYIDETALRTQIGRDLR